MVDKTRVYKPIRWSNLCHILINFSPAICGFSGVVYHLHGIHAFLLFSGLEWTVKQRLHLEWWTRPLGVCLFF